MHPNGANSPFLLLVSCIQRAISKGCDIIIGALNKIKESVPNLRILSFGSSLPCVELPLPIEY